MKRRTVLMGSAKGPWIPVHEGRAALVISGLQAGAVELEVRGPNAHVRNTFEQDGRYEVPETGWLRVSSTVRCPSLVCQLEH